ncbi:MAG: hypothetical protein R3D81_09425 [Thalassovita sp.]
MAAGNDTLSGQGGNDTLWGNEGADTFLFYAGDGNSLIRDFSTADGDMLELDSTLWDSFGPLTAAEVMGHFATWGTSGIELQFIDNGEVIVLDGVWNMTDLEAQIAIM